MTKQSHKTWLQWVVFRLCRLVQLCTCGNRLESHPQVQVDTARYGKVQWVGGNRTRRVATARVLGQVHPVLGNPHSGGLWRTTFCRRKTSFTAVFSEANAWYNRKDFQFWKTLSGLPGKFLMKHRFLLWRLYTRFNYLRVIPGSLSVVLISLSLVLMRSSHCSLVQQAQFDVLANVTHV
jgi:hypothetical protein